MTLTGIRQITPTEAALLETPNTDASGNYQPTPFVFVAGIHHNCKHACCNSSARQRLLKEAGWTKDTKGNWTSK
jgi:hypothetical protein